MNERIKEFGLFWSLWFLFLLSNSMVLKLSKDLNNIVNINNLYNIIRQSVVHLIIKQKGNWHSFFSI